MRTQNPETMTPAERDAEVASILALGLARAIHADRSRSTREASGRAKSDAERLELPQHADLSVSAPHTAPGLGHSGGRTDAKRNPNV
jgi:hypothetical protein